MALYHKYRPQKFTDIIDQEHIIKTLNNQVSGNKVAHAYLFSGPRGIGKTTTARILAKAVNCPQRKDKTSEPCNKCETCLEIAESRSIDVIEIDAASHTGVDNVRENIIDNAQFKPTKSPYKIFIIDEAHMLSTAAFNALLKTLEEPPAHVLFILATTELHKLPETIISRCQRFDFHKIPYEAMKKYLATIAKSEDVKVDKEVIERIINKSDGAARDAISLLDQIMSTGEKTITTEVASLVLPTTNVEKTLEFVNALIKRDLNTSLTILNQTVEAGINLTQFAHDVIELLRLIMVRQSNSKSELPGLDLSDKIKKDLDKLVKAISQVKLVTLIDLLLIRRQQIKTAPLPQLPLEMAAIEWCSDNQTVNTKPPASNSTSNFEVSKVKKDTKTEKITIKDKVKSIVSKSPAFTLSEVESKWNDFMSRIEKLYPSLTFILKMAEIFDVQGNTLQVAVEFDFHRDKLLDKKCRTTLEKLLSEILGKKIKLDVVVQEKNGKVTEDDELKKLASSIGGEVIN